MLKTIVVRGKKDIVAVFSKYAESSGKQDVSRPKATMEFIEFISKMPLNDETVKKLKKASKQHLDETSITDDMVPTNIKIIIDIEEKIWEEAMKVFKYVFALKGNPQMPYFLRVAGIAYMNDINTELGTIENMDLSEMSKIFTEMILTDKNCKELIEIRKILVDWRNNR